MALLIEKSDFRTLVEAGPAIMGQLARANVPATEIERIFVTHSHGDHTLGFPMLALNRLGASSPLHVHAGRNTITTLEKLCALAYPNFAHRFNLRWHELSEEGADDVGLGPGVTLRTAVVPHPRGIPTLAARWDLRGQSVTLATDTFPCDATAELARGSDLLIHEASFSATLQPDADPAAHFHSTAREAGEIARQAGCPCLALVHMGPMISEHPDVLIEEARAGTDLQVVVPEDGERIRL